MALQHTADETGARPVELHRERWNPGGKGRVLLVHGLASSSGTWWRVASGLADAGLDVTVADLRGHGMSPVPAEYGFDAHVADLARLGPGWDVVVGHSLAGPIVARLASRVEVAAAVLVDPVFEIADDEFEAVLADQLGELDPHATAEALHAANPRWHPHDAHRKAIDARTTSPTVVEWCLRHNHPFAHLGDLADVAAPTIVLGADPERGTMAPQGSIDGVGNVRVEHRVVAGAGHGIQREQPEVVVGAVLELLARVAAP